MSSPTPILFTDTYYTMNDLRHVMTMAMSRHVTLRCCNMSRWKNPVDLFNSVLVGFNNPKLDFEVPFEFNFKSNKLTDPPPTRFLFPLTGPCASSLAVLYCGSTCCCLRWPVLSAARNKRHANPGEYRFRQQKQRYRGYGEWEPSF